MSQITRVPRGLQDFLGSQNFGQNPREFGQVVLPTIDVEPFLRVDKVRYYIGASDTGPATGDVLLDVTVPLGEIWPITAFGTIVNNAAPAANDGFSVSFTMNNSPLKEGPFTNDFIGIGPSLDIVATTAAINSYALQHDYPLPFIAQGGMRLRMFASTVSGAGWVVKPFFRFSKLEA